MGADYYIYTEVKRKDGSWHALNGKYYNESKSLYEISETYHSGSRTYFSKTYNKLREIGSLIKTNALSPEILEKEDWLVGDDESCAIVVSLIALRKSIPNIARHQCCGYVHKRVIWECEVNGEEIDDYLDSDEYNELSDAEKQEYEFYEWDDPTGWFVHLKEIAAIVNFQIEEYMRVNMLWNEPDGIRIVCIASY